MTTTPRDISHSWDGFHMQRSDISSTRNIISDADCGCGEPSACGTYTLCVVYFVNERKRKNKKKI